MMFWQPRRMTAHDLARDFVVTSQAFADTFIQYVAAEHIGESAALVLNRRMETCAVVWASILATFEASGLGTEEREKVIPLVRDGLVPYWRKYGADDFAFTSHVLERSSELINNYELDSASHPFYGNRKSFKYPFYPLNVIRQCRRAQRGSR
jgi:hypothetical protein